VVIVALYQYRVRDQHGKIIKGLMEAKNINIVVEKLRLSGYFITSIKEKAISKKGLFFQKYLKVSRIDLTKYLKVFSLILDFGLPIGRTLDILAEQVIHPKLTRITDSVKRDVEKGSPLAAALEKYPDVFSEMFRSAVRRGEVRGELKVVINQLALHYEGEGKIREKISRTLGFPLVVTGFLSILLLGLVAIIIPYFSPIFNSLDLNLPVFTTITLTISNLIHDYILELGLIFLIVGYIYRLAIRGGKGRNIWDKFLLQIPVIGEVIRKLALARGYFLLETLLKSGVSINEAFEIAQSMSGNQAIAEDLQRVPMEIQNEENLLRLTKEGRGLLPPDLKLMALGDRAMNLEVVLGKMADLYLDEVYYLNHYYLRNGLLLLICFLCLLIFAIILSIGLPLIEWGTTSMKI
jgi:type IV pilus assembly protein PilC